MLNVIVFGAPGSGKGTQSELIIKKYGLHHISTGDLLRKEIAKETDLGKEAACHINKGHLVPDELIIQVIDELLQSRPTAKGFVFDGFPRTLAQGKSLDAMLKEKNMDVTMVFNLSVDEEELTQRLLKRGEASGRSDDTHEVIKNRLEVYRQQTEPLKEYYKKKGKLYSIKGSGTVEDISESISEMLDRLTQ